jgi:membrane protein
MGAATEGDAHSLHFDLPPFVAGLAAGEYPFPALRAGNLREIAARTLTPAARAQELLRLLGRGIADDRLLTYAAAIAFQSLIALIPLTLFGLGLLGAFGLADTWSNSIAPAIQPRVTQPVFHAIDFTARRVLEHGSAGLIVFGALLATWYLAAAIRTIEEALNQIHEQKDSRTWVRRGLVSAALAVAVGGCLVGSFLVVVAAPRAARHGAGHVLLGLGRWAAAVLLLSLAVGLLVRYAPSEHPEPRWASAGSALVVGGWIVASVVFRELVSSVLNFRSPSGSLTGLIALNGYLFTSALIFLVGVELDELLRRGTRATRR